MVIILVLVVREFIHFREDMSLKRFSHFRPSNLSTFDLVTSKLPCQLLLTLANSISSKARYTLAIKLNSTRSTLLKVDKIARVALAPYTLATKSVELRHVQRPWTTPNPDFKVRPFFDAEYLQNGKRYGHSYYWRRIGNRTQAFKWYHFQWPWVTSNPYFKVTIIFNIGK